MKKYLLTLMIWSLCSHSFSRNMIPPQAIDLYEHKNIEESISTFKINEERKANVITWSRNSYEQQRYIECKHNSEYENIQVWLPPEGAEFIIIYFNSDDNYQKENRKFINVSISTKKVTPDVYKLWSSLGDTFVVNKECLQRIGDRLSK